MGTHNWRNEPSSPLRRASRKCWVQVPLRTCVSAWSNGLLETLQSARNLPCDRSYGLVRDYESSFTSCPHDEDSDDEGFCRLSKTFHFWKMSEICLSLFIVPLLSKSRDWSLGEWIAYRRLNSRKETDNAIILNISVIDENKLSDSKGSVEQASNSDFQKQARVNTDAWGVWLGLCGV